MFKGYLSISLNHHAINKQDGGGLIICCYLSKTCQTCQKKSDSKHAGKLNTDCKSAQRHHLMLCRGACMSRAFCSLIAYSWLDLAVCDTQRPVVSKKRIESTRSKSQISPEWAERHKFSPTDCCPRHVLPIERMNNEHSHHRLLCQGRGLLRWNATGNEGITVCQDTGRWQCHGWRRYQSMTDLCLR